MEVKKNILFVVINKHKLKDKTKPLPKTKTKPRTKTRLEARGLSLENKKKSDDIYAKGFVKTSRKQF